MNKTLKLIIKSFKEVWKTKEGKLNLLLLAIECLIIIFSFKYITNPLILFSILLIGLPLSEELRTRFMSIC